MADKWGNDTRLNEAWGQTHEVNVERSLCQDGWPVVPNDAQNAACRAYDVINIRHAPVNNGGDQRARSSTNRSGKSKKKKNGAAGWKHWSHGGNNYKRDIDRIFGDQEKFDLLGMPDRQWKEEEQAVLHAHKRKSGKLPFQESKSRAKKQKLVLFETANSQAIKMDSIKSSLKARLESLERSVPALAANYKMREEQFKDIKSQLDIANAESKQLAEENRIIAECLQNSAQEVECYKHIRDQFKEEKSQMSKEKDKIAYELQKTQQELENYKQKSEQATKDIHTLKGELKYAVEEKCEFLKEKNQMLDKLRKAEQMLAYYKQKSNQFKEMQTQFDKLKAELECAAEQKIQISNEKDKIADELQKAKEEVEDYRQNADRLKVVQQQFDQLNAQSKHIAEEKSEASKELVTTRQVLKHNEKAFRNFIKEFMSTGVDPKVSDTDDSFNCLICMEPWTESGKHNICSLACGHFFGRSCITEWIKQQCGGSSSKCPTCQRKATLKDIRNHYLQDISLGHGKSQ